MLVEERILNMNISSYMPVQIINGKGCVSTNYHLFEKMGKSCLIVTGGNSAKKCGALDDVINVLVKRGISYTVFDGITENPQTADCHRAGEKAREIDADFIIGIGGGSPLDASKAVAIYAANPELAPADIYLRKYDSKPLPVVLVGTTSGTGSEVTGVSVLTDSSVNLKKSISGPDCYSVVSFCDYTYTTTMPYAVTVSTALDAFAHAVEAYFSSTANDISDVYAEKAFSMLRTGLLHFYNNKTLPDESLREELYTASLFAGLCLNITGTCFPHTMGYILTEDFGIAHGRACAAFIPDFIRISAENMPQKAQKLFDIMGMDCHTLCNLVETLADINITINSEQMAKYENRWTDPVKNFSRTPGNFTSATAVDILKRWA